MNYPPGFLSDIFTEITTEGHNQQPVEPDNPPGGPARPVNCGKRHQQLRDGIFIISIAQQRKNV